MQGRVVLVTGAARGIGKEVARQLADLGASVLVSARKVDDARAAAKDLSAVGDVRGLEVGLDVTDDSSVQAAAKALWRDPSRLDVLVNNAAAYVDWSETASSAASVLWGATLTDAGPSGELRRDGSTQSWRGMAT
jgi:NAD(P)-dependent dehydrogenase (short-subunit alcohol dehydrogenase family)